MTIIKYAEDFEEGYPCPMAADENGEVACTGRLEIKEPEDCSCHISAPCSAHVEAALWCPVCGWEVEDVEI